MNKLLMLFFAVGLSVAASAQPKIGGTVKSSTTIRSGGTGGGTKGHVTVIVPSYRVYPRYGYGFGYNPYVYGFGYSPYYDPFNRFQRVEERPSQLDLAIDDIKEDYDYQISTAKHDKSLSKDERKQKVRYLKHQRDDAISDAKKNYYKKGDKVEDTED